MGFQMLAAIAAGVLLGIYLDKSLRQPEQFPLFTVIGSLLGVFLALYLPLKELLKK
jgi:F0F1-type ATP synthase assembly protein I